MTRASKLTPAKMKKIRDARGAGASLRAAAKAAGVSHESVRAWEAKQTKRASSSAAAKQTKKVASRASPVKTASRPSKAMAAADAAIEELLGGGSPAQLVLLPLEEVHRRQALVRRLLERLEPAVERDEYPATSFVTLAKYGDDLVRTVAELTPPDVPDPNDHPDAREAERVLLARLEGMISDAEGRATKRNETKKDEEYTQ